MRVWDIDPVFLCRKHLLGEHREIHCIFTVLDEGKQGYSKHPETLRWRGRLPALAARHDAVVAEMSRRGYNHASPLPTRDGSATPLTYFINTLDEQIDLLISKGCDCHVTRGKS